MNNHHVFIGQIALGGHDDVLQASLGSCIGIGIIWSKKGICGLAHCLLPHAVDNISHPPGRYVEEAIPALLEKMNIKEEDKKEIQVIIVGGGNMTHGVHVDGEKLIGEANALMAKAICKQLKLKVVFEDVLGDFGRKIVLNCLNSTYQVSQIPRLFKVG